MRVMQIATGYFSSTLYAKMFKTLEKNGIVNVVFVPTQNSVRIKREDIYVYPCFSQLDRVLYFSKQKKIVKGLENVIDLEKINIVHAHTLFSAGYAALKLKEKYNIPYIVAVRNTDINVFFKRMVYLRKVGIKVMLEAEKVLFLSPVYLTDTIETYVPLNIRDKIHKKSVVIPNGISEVFLNNSLKEGRPYIRNIKDIKLIYAGEINRNKNLKETIKAVHILREKGYKISIIVVGDVTDPGCKNLVKEDYVEYHEKCSQEQLIKYYREADIFVMPSHAETFGLVYAEAMSQGLPVLYTRGQGFDGHFAEGEVGYAVSDNDAGELAEKIEMVIMNYARISENCVRLVKRFDWNEIGKKYEKIYHSIV